MFGISGNEFMVILVLAVLLIGPQRLPEYTKQLTHLIRQFRLFLDNAKTQIAQEVGPEIGDLKLSDLDPRQYDPRKIVREALGEDLESIRRDLENPFKTVAEAAKSTADELAGDINEIVAKDRDDTLSKRIKAAQEEAEAVTTELPQVTSADMEIESESEDAADAAADSSDSSDSTAGGEDEAAGSEDVPDAAADSGESSDVNRRDAIEQAVQAVDEALEDVVSSGDDMGAIASAAIASTVTDAQQHSAENSSETRSQIVSPRDIIRAAQAAARTRDEASTASLAS